MTKHAKGFTLIEIMIALAVFACLAMITASTLYYAFDTRERITEEARQLSSLQFALSLLALDTQQFVARSIHGDEMREFPAFVGQPSYVEFTQGGVVNASDTTNQSTLRRRAYLCQGHRLIRRTWSRLDSPSRDSYTDKILLEGLNRCRFAFLDHSHQVLPEWREHAVKQNQQQAPLPIAIQLNIDLQDRGDLSLLFPIPEGLYHGN